MKGVTAEQQAWFDHRITAQYGFCSCGRPRVALVKRDELGTYLGTYLWCHACYR